MIADLVRLSRPKHWIKNVFSFLPVPFALASGAHLDVVRFAYGVAAFCLAASAVYAFNDAQDAERDRMHEEKKNRPIAAGRISKGVAYVWATGLIGIGALLSMMADGFGSGRYDVLMIYALYVAMNLAYSFGAKHVTLLDVFLLSAMYVLRVLLGCALLRVEASHWLLLCSGALALFVALAKRRADVVKGHGAAHRPALEGYNESFLDQAIGISACMTIIAYALYSKEAPVLDPARKFAALPFVVFAVLDYLRNVHVNRSGGSPVDSLLRSPTLIFAGIGWFAATLLSLRWQ